jgi:hypothetical protein
VDDFIDIFEDVDNHDYTKKDVDNVYGFLSFSFFFFDQSSRLKFFIFFSSDLRKTILDCDG